jgi:hypothetical protein
MNEKLPMQSLHSRGSTVERAAFAFVAFAALFCAAANADATLADPTRPVTAATISEGHPPREIRVEAILDRGHQRVAIVEGKVVRVGDRLPWGQVEEVTATGVRYVVAGHTQFVALEIPKLQVRRVSQGDAP